MVLHVNVFVFTKMLLGYIEILSAFFLTPTQASKEQKNERGCGALSAQYLSPWECDSPPVQHFSGDTE